MKIICISGKAQHGKDTSADMLKSFMDLDGRKARIIHYADLLKFICKSWFDWNGEKDDYGRSLLQRVGTDIIRMRDPDYWVDFVAGFLKLFPDEWDYVIIPDCRFPNEIRVMKSNFDTIHCRVVRNNFNSPLRIEQQNHISETALDNLEPDYVFHNTSDLTNLRARVAEFYYNALRGGESNG